MRTKLAIFCQDDRRSSAYREAALGLFQCAILDETAGPSDVAGACALIVDGEQVFYRTRSRVAAWSSQAGGAPVLYVYGGPNEESGNPHPGRFVAGTPPRAVIAGVMECLYPNRSFGEAVTALGVDRAKSILGRLMTEARHAGPDLSYVDTGVESVMRAMRDSTLANWLAVVWTHDEITAQHSLLVSGLAAMMATHLGFSREDARRLTRAAVLHDVGKARIPLAILNKPGRLTDDEMTVMRTHAGIGHDLLLAAGETDPLVLDIVLHHHEMLDGSGYPDALRADRISDPVRLVTIVDIYAALIERRS